MKSKIYYRISKVRPILTTLLTVLIKLHVILSEMVWPHMAMPYLVKSEFYAFTCTIKINKKRCWNFSADVHSCSFL